MGLSVIGWVTDERVKKAKARTDSHTAEKSLYSLFSPAISPSELEIA